MKYYKSGIGHAFIMEDKIFMHSQLTGPKIASARENKGFNELIDSIFEESSKEVFEGSILDEDRYWRAYKAIYSAALTGRNLHITFIK